MNNAEFPFMEEVIELRKAVTTLNNSVENLKNKKEQTPEAISNKTKQYLSKLFINLNN